MVQRQVQRTVDEQASIAKSFVSVAIGPKRFQDMKHAAADRAVGYLSQTALHAKDYATSALDVAGTSSTSKLGASDGRRNQRRDRCECCCERGA